MWLLCIIPSASGWRPDSTRTSGFRVGRTIEYDITCGSASGSKQKKTNESKVARKIGSLRGWWDDNLSTICAHLAEGFWKIIPSRLRQPRILDQARARTQRPHERGSSCHPGDSHVRPADLDWRTSTRRTPGPVERARSWRLSNGIAPPRVRMALQPRRLAAVHPSGMRYFLQPPVAAEASKTADSTDVQVFFPKAPKLGNRGDCFTGSALFQPRRVTHTGVLDHLDCLP